MSAPAWMPLYIADYLADTGHLSTFEHGAYMLLIMHYWQNGGLPNDPERLARIARMRTREWGRIESTMQGLFGENWTHKRIDHELMTAREMIEKRSVAGKMGAAARYGARMAEVQRERSNRMANAWQTDSIARVRNLNQDIIPSSVQSTTQAQEESGSAGQQGEVVPVVPALLGKDEPIPVSSSLLNTRMMRKHRAGTVQ